MTDRAKERDGVYCGSPGAIRAAATAYPGADSAKLADALIASHHPVLGLDRSVCLRDIIEALDKEAGMGFGDPDDPFWYVARFLERKFNG
jgi:hypothetical protein